MLLHTISWSFFLVTRAILYPTTEKNHPVTLCSFTPFSAVTLTIPAKPKTLDKLVKSVHISRPIPKKDDKFKGREVFTCGSPTMAYIAAKKVPHREILLEKNINENIFQWILGYPCTVKQIKENVGGEQIGTA